MGADLGTGPRLARVRERTATDASSVAAVAAPADLQDVGADSLPVPPDLRDRFNLSTKRLWNLLRELVDSLLGGDEPADLHGDCRLLWDVRDDVLENWRDVEACMCIGCERWAGDPCNTNQILTLSRGSCLRK